MLTEKNKHPNETKHLTHLREAQHRERDVDESVPAFQEQKVEAPQEGGRGQAPAAQREHEVAEQHLRREVPVQVFEQVRRSVFQQQPWVVKHGVRKKRRQPRAA